MRKKVNSCGFRRFSDVAKYRLFWGPEKLNSYIPVIMRNAALEMRLVWQPPEEA